MLLCGIVLGPFCLNLIDGEILRISSQLRQIALIIILTRAGLALDIGDLKKVGRPALLMCFIPATFEIAATTLLAPLFFDISRLEAAILGAVLGAVSPAVIVPKMLMLMEKGSGKNKRIPQLIMAGASADDVYVIVLFAAFMGIYKGAGFQGTDIIKIPLAVIAGLIAGILIGLLFVSLFRKIHVRDTVKVMVLLGLGFLFVSLETILPSFIPFSGLLAVMSLGGTILNRQGVGQPPLAKRLSEKYAKLWVFAELLLFVLVGASLNLAFVRAAGIKVVLVIALALVIRLGGVLLCLVKTNLNAKERIFCALAYMPKATVQAAIGGVPLSQGVASGNIILTVAVIAILITAPLGSFFIDLTYRNALGDS
jgi:NhaP-type Na+/H+ or K+/H+ antiporter